MALHTLICMQTVWNVNPVHAGILHLPFWEAAYIVSVETTWIITFASNILSLATLQFLLSLLKSLLRSGCECSAARPPVQSTLLLDDEIKLFIFTYLLI